MHVYIYSLFMLVKPSQRAFSILWNINYLAIGGLSSLIVSCFFGSVIHGGCKKL